MFSDVYDIMIIISYTDIKDERSNARHYDLVAN